MIPLRNILPLLLFCLAAAGSVFLFCSTFISSSAPPPRKEYDLELRYVLNLSREKTSAPAELPEPRNTGKYTEIPEKYRPIILRESRKHNIPPEIIAGIITRESDFDPKAQAPDGGRGLMQLMPAVCKERNCPDPFDPESNIRAGCAHLAALRSSFASVPQKSEQLKFAIAAYNCGAGHVMDARILARRLKLDPDRWEQNVEESIKFLKFRSFYKTLRHGYCNGTLTADYVNGVLALSEKFVQK